MTKIKITANISEDVEKPDWSYIASGNINKMAQKKSRAVSLKKKLNMLTIQPSNCPLESIYPREMKTNVHIKTCT